MAGSRPVAMYAMRVPPGNVLVPAVPEFAPMFRVTMAAIDPTEELDIEAVEDKQKPRATLKIVRIPDFDDSEDEDDDEESDEEGINGGPSKTKTGDNDDDEDEDDDDDDESMDDAEAEAVLAKLMGTKKKGKSKASDDDDEEDEDEDDEDDLEESLSMDECVLCTLDPEKNYQQPLDFHVAEGERVFFKVSGNLTVHLTGNYVMPLDDDDEDEEDDDEDNEYDLSPDEDELDGLDALVDGDESDELDDLDDPRVMEIDNEEEEKPQKLPAPAKKGKNKRPAEDDAELDVSLDDIMAKSLKKEDAAPSEQPKKMTKAEKKAAKKLKNNEGEAAAAPAQSKKETAQSNGTPSSDSDKKKVQFAKNLEQGPTPSKSDAKTDAKAEAKADSKDKKTSSVSLGVKDVNGVTVDDRKIGSGPAAKKGSRLEMRYIGKLDNGKVFDANKSGKPFSFKLGSGEVIKGWDIGLAGISSGGERRLIIPAHLAYGKKGVAGIPPNSRLTFDIKCLSVK